MKVCANSDLTVTYIIWFIISYHLGSETTFVLSHSIYKLLSGPWYRKAEDNKLGDKIRQNAVFLAMSLFRWYMYNIYIHDPSNLSLPVSKPLYMYMYNSPRYRFNCFNY